MKTALPEQGRCRRQSPLRSPERARRTKADADAWTVGADARRFVVVIALVVIARRRRIIAVAVVDDHPPGCSAPALADGVADDVRWLQCGRRLIDDQFISGGCARADE